jgi:hypothetical protein
MNTIDLPAIKARMEKATPGDWTVTQFTNYRGYAIYAPGRGCIAERWYDFDQVQPYGDEIKANADFIAHARTDIQLLVQEVERLQIQHGTCSVCGYVAWQERGKDTQHCVFCELHSSLRAKDEALRRLAETACHSHACYDPPERSYGVAPLKRECAEDCEIRLIRAALSDAGKEGK